MKYKISNYRFLLLTTALVFLFTGIYSVKAENNEVILLGRSLWRRHSNKSLINGTKGLEAMLEGLNPQSPPIPTPLLARE